MQLKTAVFQAEIEVQICRRPVLKVLVLFIVKTDEIKL